MEVASLADDRVAAYAGTYLSRKPRFGGDRFFGNGDADALAALLLIDLGPRLSHERARHFAAHEAVLVAAAVARTDSASEAPSELARLVALLAGVDAQAAPHATPVREMTPLEAAWCGLRRATAAARGLVLDDDLGAEARTLALRRLKAMPGRLESADDDAVVSALARIVYVCGRWSRLDEDLELLEASERAAEQLGDWLLEADESGARLRSLSSAHLAQVVLAADVTSRSELWSRAVAELLGPQRDAGRLVSSRRNEPGKSELSPWVPLALLTASEDVDAAADVFDPQSAAMPTFTIQDVRSRKGGLDCQIAVGGAVRQRRYDERDFNLLVDRVLTLLESIDDSDQSARTHAHMVIALCEIERRCGDEATRAAVAAQIDRSLTVLTSTQDSNGGWSYGYKAKPSHVYSHGSLRSTEFPDLQYTIDSAVPGIALVMGYERSGSPNLLASAKRVLAFFEQAIGRVSWNSFNLWRLFPEDEKTAQQGSAVNYELWNSWFFASLAMVSESDEERDRLRSYVRRSVDYAESHLHDTGDIEYGDYVTELRTAYASWDAMLLAEIAQREGDPRALECSRRIVHRLAEVMLPSGAIPNVVDYADTVDDVSRWTVHRHGVGPFPIRTDYQLYFVIAAVRSDAALDAARRSLAFVLTAFFEPVFGYVGAGLYDGQGHLDPRPGVFARDWVLLALASMDRLANVDYQPVRTHVRVDRDRLTDALDSWYTNVFSGEDATGDIAAWLGRGCAALHGATGNLAWHSRAVELSRRAVGGDQALKHHLELDLEPARSSAFDTADAEATGTLQHALSVRILTPEVAEARRAHLAQALLDGEGGELADAWADPLLLQVALEMWAFEGASRIPPALGPALDDRRKLLFDRYGRYTDTYGPGRLDRAAAWATCLVLGGRAWRRPALRKQGHAALRFLLHSERGPDGALSDGPSEAAARAFYSLARFGAIEDRLFRLSGAPPRVADESKLSTPSAG